MSGERSGLETRRQAEANEVDASAKKQTPLLSCTFSSESGSTEATVVRDIRLTVSQGFHPDDSIKLTEEAAARVRFDGK